MKICFKCHKEKLLSEFYTHHQMLDGHLNKCKDCTRSDTANNTARKSLDPTWVISERRRHRAKSKLARESGLVLKIPKEKARLAQIRHRAKFADKNKARNIVGQAITKGLMNRKPCRECGRKAQAHH